MPDDPAPPSPEPPPAEKSIRMFSRELNWLGAASVAIMRMASLVFPELKLSSRFPRYELTVEVMPIAPLAMLLVHCKMVCFIPAPDTFTQEGMVICVPPMAMVAGG